MDIHLLTAAHIPRRGQEPQMSAREEDRYYYDHTILSRSVERLLGQIVAIVGAAKVQPSNMTQSITEPAPQQSSSTRPMPLANSIPDA